MDEIINGFSVQLERFDSADLSLERLPDLFTGATLFAAERLIVFKDVSSNKSVWSILAEWLDRVDDSTTIIFVEPHPDKRTKTYKWLEKHAEVSTFRELQAHETLKWLEAEVKNRGLDMSRDVVRSFAEHVGQDQWRLSSELDKLVLVGKPVSRELIRELVEPTPQATSFELLDAAFAGRREEVKRLLATVARQEDPYMFFGLLSGQVYALALVKTAGDRSVEAIAKETGVHPFVLKKISAWARGVGGNELKRIISELAVLDAHIKSRPAEPWTQIQVMLLRLKD